MEGRVDIAGLYAALNARRQARELSWRQLAGEAGVSPSLLSRMGNGQRPDLEGFAALVQWLGVDAETFMAAGNRVPPPNDDFATEVSLLLRAQKDLSDTDRRHLQEVVETTLRYVRSQREE